MRYIRWYVAAVFFVMYHACLLSTERPGCGLVTTESCTDFNYLEQLAQETQIYDTLENNPPQPIQVWAAKIGLPLLQFYIVLEQKFKKGWQSLIAFISTMQKRRAHKSYE